LFEKISTIGELLSLTSDYYGKKPAFSYLKDGKSHSVSYSEFAQQVNLAAKSLILKGIRNSKISVVSENSITASFGICFTPFGYVSGYA
jgi:long-subunit acyl-CoA synthetase (AMP-forming)